MEAKRHDFDGLADASPGQRHGIHIKSYPRSAATGCAVADRYRRCRLAIAFASDG